jgi:diguanylate cyclase (GGDEF)-like protein
MVADAYPAGADALTRSPRVPGNAAHPTRRTALDAEAPSRLPEGVTSRRRFNRLVTQALLRDEPYIVAKLDVDNFRAFRSLHGAPAADALVREIGHRLDRAAQAVDGQSARIGADEFALLVPESEIRGGIEAWADSVLAIACGPFLHRDRQLAFSASLGFVHATEQPLTAMDALRCAELAVDRGKQSGGGIALPCSAAQFEQARGRDELYLGLRAAIANGQIVPYYQPIVSLATGLITGMEVLARWQHPLHGTLPPAAFIVAAEDQGLCAALTDALMRGVERESHEWPGDWHFAFNIPPRDVLEVLRSIAMRDQSAADALPPHRIELEVTETAVMRDLAGSRTLIDAIGPSGVKLVLDDFGTGYANFQQLRQIPFSRLKIDKSFVTDMLGDPRGTACVQAIIDLTHLLGMTTIAEGVETADVSERLVAMGCDHAQGYLYARPMPAADVMRLLDTMPIGHGGMPHAA